ncbi:hypothetical protein ABKN59_001760 [Abortiporus biennis]
MSFDLATAQHDQQLISLLDEWAEPRHQLQPILFDCRDARLLPHVKRTCSSAAYLLHQAFKWMLPSACINRMLQ